MLDFLSEAGGMCDLASRKRRGWWQRLRPDPALEEARFLIPTGGWGLSLREDRWEEPPLGPVERGKLCLAACHARTLLRSKHAVRAKESYEQIMRQQHQRELQQQLAPMSTTGSYYEDILLFFPRREPFSS